MFKTRQLTEEELKPYNDKKRDHLITYIYEGMLCEVQCDYSTAQMAERIYRIGKKHKEREIKEVLGLV